MTLFTEPDHEGMLPELYDCEQIQQIEFRDMKYLDLKRWDEMAETFTKDAHHGLAGPVGQLVGA